MTAALRLLTSAVVVLASGVPAFGQAAPAGQGPGGLFGGDKPGRHKLDLTASAIGANDSDTPTDLIGIVPTESQIGGFSTMLLGKAEYRYDGNRVDVGVTGNMSFRHYAEVSEAQTTSYNFGAGLSAALSPRTNLYLNQSVAYSPSYLYGLFPSTERPGPGDVTPIAPDYVVDDNQSYAYTTTVSLKRGLSRRSDLAVGADYSYTNYVNETARLQDLDSTGAHATYSRNVSKNVALSVGYRYRTGTFGYALPEIGLDVGATSTEHGVDIGVHYARPLSATRSLSFDASFGPSSVSLPRVSESLSGNDRLVRGSGSIALGYQFVQNWQIRGAYSRSLEFIATLGQPVYADGISADVTGLLTSRLEVSASGRYSSGASLLNAQNQLLDSMSASARLQYAVSRSVAAYAEYIYYYYSFNRPVLPAPTLPRQLERNGVRVGLTFWVPAFRR
jgi:hypothetical protein